MTLDIKLFYFLNNFAGKSQAFDILVIFFASYLHYIVIAIFLLLLYFSAYPRREKIGIFLTTTVSIIIARFGIVELIRFFYHRPRPFMVLPIHYLFTDNEWSFPSGHATFFFAMAMAIYLYNKKWGTWFFVAATLITISRVIGGVHYPSDILGGMIVGMIVAYIVFYCAKKIKKA